MGARIRCQNAVPMRAKRFGLAALLALSLLILLPFYTNGFWFDDALNGQIRPMLQRFESSVFDFSMRVTSLWMSNAGRLLLGWVNIYTMFYVLHEPLWARGFAMLLLMVHIGLFASVLGQLRARAGFILLVCLLLVSLFQIRGNHDPVAAYASFYQTLGIQFMAGTWLLLRWRETKKTWQILASSLVVAWSLTYYEINLVFYPFALWVAWREPGSRARALPALLAPLAVFIAVTSWIKANANSPYAGSSLGAIDNFPSTFLRQLHSTLPGSFYSMVGKHELPPQQLLQSAIDNPWAWVLLVLGFGLAFVLMRRSEGKGLDPLIWPFAANLLIMPAALIAMSARYQSEIRWGYGYLPVYYQYFGLAIFIAYALTFCARRLSLAVAVSLIFGAYLALNFQMNMTVKARMDALFRQPRESFESAMRAGLMNDVRDGDVVRLVDAPIEINGNLIFGAVGKRVFVPDEVMTSGWFVARKRQDARSFTVRRSNGTWEISEDKP